MRPPARTLSLSAEAVIDGNEGRPVAIVFGPENGAVSEAMVFEAAKEASAKEYSHLYVIGFAIQPDARRLVEDCERAVGVPATYAQASMDLIMKDLLKNLRSSQIFSVCGLPDVRIRRETKNGYRVELRGLDVFDPVEMNSDHRDGQDVPAWFLDTDYNGLCFHVCQAFFPRTSAWAALKKSLRGEFDESVWAHLSGTVSTLFEAGGRGQIAVKVVDDRGNDLDRHDLVHSFVKNAGLGFSIPYLHNGEHREYLPGFIVRLAGSDERYLILETKGYDPLKEVKEQAANRWVRAVNGTAAFGSWSYAMVSDMNIVADVVTRAAAGSS